MSGMLMQESQEDSNRIDELIQAHRFEYNYEKKKLNNFSKFSNSTNVPRKSLIQNRLSTLHKTGKSNRYYLSLFNRYKNKKKNEFERQKYKNINNKQLKNELENHLRKRYNNNEYGKRLARKEYLLGTINILGSMIQNDQKKGGKQKRKQKIKGKRVLKNGAVAGYVKQKNGTWRWSFLPRN